MHCKRGFVSRWKSFGCLPIAQVVMQTAFIRHLHFLVSVDPAKISHSNTALLLRILSFSPVLMYLSCLSTHVFVTREYFQCSGYFDPWEFFLGQHPLYIAENTKKSPVTSWKTLTLPCHALKPIWGHDFFFFFNCESVQYHPAGLWLGLVSSVLSCFSSSRYAAFPRTLWCSLHELCFCMWQSCLQLVHGKKYCVGRSVVTDWDKHVDCRILNGTCRCSRACIPFIISFVTLPFRRRVHCPRLARKSPSALP